MEKRALRIVFCDPRWVPQPNAAVTLRARLPLRASRESEVAANETRAAGGPACPWSSASVAGPGGGLSVHLQSVVRSVPGVLQGEETRRLVRWGAHRRTAQPESAPSEHMSSTRIRSRRGAEEYELRAVSGAQPVLGVRAPRCANSHEAAQNARDKAPQHGRSNSVIAATSTG